MTRSGSGALLRAILLATLVAGALDITAALLLNLRVGPLIVLQSVSSGWMGTAAYGADAGWTTGLQGLAAHFGIMLVIAAIYMIPASRSAPLRRQWIVAGVVWGAAVWVVMTLVVVPMSASPLPIPDTLHIIQGLIVHVLMVGLPMAWIARRAFRV